MLLSYAIVIIAIIPFFRMYEKRKPKAREVVLIAMYTAITVTAQIFFHVTVPIQIETSLTIIAGVSMGPQVGFLIGALVRLICNFYMGQGPWTPFQMITWGIIGLFAGLLAAALKKSRLLLLCYGAVSGVLFSILMDVWTVLWMNREFSLGAYGAAIVSALPFTILYMVSNVAFLWLFAKPFGEKMERMHYRYGI